MNKINYENVQIKNLIGIIENPTIEDLLFEIVNFLSDENRTDGIFNVKEASLKSRVRINEDFFEDINLLESKEYIKKLNYTKYQVIKHLWE
jgi:hypothetical protein